MGAPQNRAERGRVSVQPIYSVNQMPETGAGRRRKEPRVRAQTSTGTSRLGICDDSPTKRNVDSCYLMFIVIG